MTPNQLVDRIRRGDVDNAITDFLAATPEATLEMLAVNAMNWQMPDVAEAILRRLLRDDPENLGGQLTLAKVLYGARRFADALPHFEFTARHMPDDAWFQSGRLWGYSVLGRLDALRDAILEIKRQIPADRHVNWQHARQVENMPDITVRTLAARIAELRTRSVEERRTHTETTKVVTWTPRPRKAPLTDGIELFGWSSGLSEARAWFVVDDAHDIPATGRVQDGATLWSAPFIPSAGKHHRLRLYLEVDGQLFDGGEVTYNSPQRQPPSATTGSAAENGSTSLIMTGRVAATGDAAQYRFEYGRSPDGLVGKTPWRPVPGKRNARFVASPEWATSRSWYYGAEMTWIDGPAPNLTVHWPFAQDPNHISGIGFMELLFACWHNSCQHDGNQRAREWECSDLRDAVVSVRLNARDLDPKNYLHCLGIGNVSTYWMLSGQAVDLSGLGDEATELTFTLPSDPAQWTIAGTNQIEQPDHERYKYGPLDHALARNQGNLVLIAPFGTPSETTTGAISIGECTVSYRDNNILHPDNGAVLIDGPSLSACDPANLTNGIYGDPDAGWFLCGHPDTPPRFVWELAAPQAITTLVIHQDPVLPTTKCRVSLSDGTNTPDTWQFDLPVPKAPFDQPALKIAAFEGSGTYSRVELELLEGAYPEGRGLQSFEIFAKNFAPPPSDLPATVSVDIQGMQPGSSVHYRVVTRTDTETAAGEVQRFDFPAENGPPLLHHVTLFGASGTKAIFQVRANAMGAAAELCWRLDDDDEHSLPLGWEQTPVHRYIVLPNVTEGTHRLTVRSRSAAGDSPEIVHEWNMPGQNQDSP